MHSIQRAFLIAPLLALSLVSAPQASLVRDGLAPTDPVVAASLPRYLFWRSARFVDWLADGSMLIATRFGDTQQIHRVRLPAGAREQVSFAPAGVIAAVARPYASDALVYLAREPGGGTQLFLQQLREHALRALTEGGQQAQTPVWAPDGVRVAFIGSDRNGADDDLYVVDTRIPGAVPRLVVPGDAGRWSIYSWSADDRHLLLGREPADAASGAGTAVDAIDTSRADTAGAIAVPEAQLYIADVDSGALAATALRATAAHFASDGQGIVLLTHELPPNGVPAGMSREYLHLAYVDLASHRWRALSAPASHDVETFAESADGRYLAYTLEDQGVSRLMLIDQHLQLERPVTALPEGIISSLGFDASGQQLALTLESTRSPADVYVLQPVTGAVTRWTQSEVGPLDTQSFVQPQWLQFPTWDRPDGQPRELSALVYNPAPTTIGAGAARAVVIWLCSGGGSQCRAGYAPFVQYLSQQLGFVVIAPNVRGSSGLGAQLLAAGQGSLREDAVRDVGSLLAWIGLQPGLDRSRVAVLGEGFGSYLALASLTRYGDRLLGAVAAFPPPLTGLTNLTALRRPVLLVQGLQDRAVPAYQVAQLREGLRAQGVTVEYLAAADEDADFSRKSARDAYHLAAASFLARLLR